MKQLGIAKLIIIIISAAIILWAGGVLAKENGLQLVHSGSDMFLLREPVVTGGCGVPYYVQDRSAPWSDKVESFAPAKHYCLFTVDGYRISLTVYGETGQVFDHVEDLAGVKGKPAGLKVTQGSRTAN